MPADRASPIAGQAQHVVQQYASDDDLAYRVSRDLAAGLEHGETAVVVATAAHCRAIETRLAAGPGFAGASAEGRFIALDAVETLGQILIGSSLSPAALELLALGLVAEALARGPGVGLYGEMVALLWSAGRPDAAIELETLSSDLSGRLPLRLLCGYPAQLAAEDAGVLRRICDLHPAVAGIPPQL